jgi:hypothetical protein
VLALLLFSFHLASRPKLYMLPSTYPSVHVLPLAISSSLSSIPTMDPKANSEFSFGLFFWNGFGLLFLPTQASYRCKLYCIRTRWDLLQDHKRKQALLCLKVLWVYCLLLAHVEG